MKLSREPFVAFLKKNSIPGTKFLLFLEKLMVDVTAYLWKKGEIFSVEEINPRGLVTFEDEYIAGIPDDQMGFPDIADDQIEDSKLFHNSGSSGIPVDSNS